MRYGLVTAVFAVFLTGCMNEARHERACKIFSPASIETPSTNQDQRIDGQSTGDPTVTEEETNC